ncbi:L-rhamnose mutarotase [Georgenia halophila]|uniref:L-rhamnose mutarotase n=1 Tax=Georgenia halophila TaxID=620889 RepID=A0ABP8LMM6_9MICO
MSDSMRVALHLRVKAGREAEYDASHREVPAELVQAIRDAGVNDWTIWRSGQDLFQLIDCDDYAAMLAKLEELPVNVAWQVRMAELQEVTHDYSDEGAGAGLPVVWHLNGDGS